MRRAYLALGLVLVLLLGAAGGAYWYFFSAPNLSADQLVPSETIFFATIPNALPLLAQYEGSDLSKLLNDPTAQGVLGMLGNSFGKKYLDAVQALLPDLSGQSFLALTHFDPDHPEAWGIIAGMKPLPGTDHFDDFIAKFKDASGDQVKNWATGNDTVGGESYTWFQPPGAPNRICVLRYGGWIITSLGPDGLKDWLERYHKKSATPSLAQNPNYQTSLQRVGTDSLTLIYLNPTRLLPPFAQYLERQKLVPSADSIVQAYQSFSLFVVGSKFQNGKIVDTSSIFLTPTGKAELGLSDTPCTFETLKFTSKNTCFYLAGTRDWNLVSQRFSRTLEKMPAPALSALTMQAETLKKLGVDVQHNIINALGPEFSFQMDWPPDAAVPDIGLFLKVDKPDDFQPVIKAIHDFVHAMTINSGVLTELDVSGQKFATYHSITPSIFTPTITENGPYFAFFLTQKYGVDSFNRDVNGMLNSNPAFQAELGDKLTNGGNATDMVYIDSPKLLDRTYQAALPYVSFLATANKDARVFLRDHELPKDLTWLAPMGPWLYLQDMDEAGLRSYSVSGVGNQGLFFGTAAIGAGMVAPSLVPKGISPAPVAMGDSTPPPPPDDKSPDSIRDDLSQLRYTILAWSKDKKIAPGTPVAWPNLAGYFVPDSHLEQSGGMDALGHYYDLGVIGVRGADVSPETKKAFPEKPDSFWAAQPGEVSAQGPAPVAPTPTPPSPPPQNPALAPPTESPSTNTPPVAPPPMTNAAPVVPPSPAVTNAPPVAPPPMTNPAPVMPPSPVVTNAPPVAPPPMTNPAPVMPPSPVVTNAPPVAPPPMTNPAPVVPPPPVITNTPPVAPPPMTNPAPVVPPPSAPVETNTPPAVPSPPPSAPTPPPTTPPNVTPPPSD